MDHEPDLTPLNGQQLDPELFHRVWARVMPDQTNSPLSLSPLPAEAASLPPQSPHAPDSPICMSETSTADVPTLQRLMDQAHGDLLCLPSLNRVGSGVGRTLSAIASDRRRALRQLSTARFLITGERYQPQSPMPQPHRSLSLVLRDQFFRAKAWEWSCSCAAAATQDPCLQELYRELAQDGALHAGSIRSALEQFAFLS